MKIIISFSMSFSNNKNIMVNSKSVFIVLLLCLFSVFCLAKDIELWNRLEGPIWVGAQANRGFPLPNGGGWAFEREQRIKIQVPDNWSGRFWPRTWCNITGDNSCETGGCGTSFECRGVRGTAPASMAEFKFRAGNIDQYSISLVHGFNTMITITPLDTEDIDPDNDITCKTVACKEKFYDELCPTEMQKRNYMYVIGCHSACDVLKTDQYCCKGSYQKSHLCNPLYWPTNYPQLFKDKCPETKTYLFDNENVIHKCKARGYLVVFNQ